MIVQILLVLTMLLTDGETSAKVDHVPPRTPVARSVQSRHTVESLAGVASFYGGTRGFHGQPHAAMHNARYTGHITRYVTVYTRSRNHLRLPVVDYCDCYVGTSDERVIDLSVEAIRKLGLDPGQGIYHVIVKWEKK